MKIAILTVGALAALSFVCGCKPSEAEVLQTALDKREAAFPGAEYCDEANKVADAWAREGEQTKYEQARLFADATCLKEQASHQIMAR